MCEQFNSGQQKRCAFIPFLHPNTGRALEHPHFTYLPQPTETTTLPPPSLSKSTALVSRSDKRQHFERQFNLLLRLLRLQYRVSE